MPRFADDGTELLDVEEKDKSQFYNDERYVIFRNLQKLSSTAYNFVEPLNKEEERELKEKNMPVPPENQLLGIRINTDISERVSPGDYVEPINPDGDSVTLLYDLKISGLMPKELVEDDKKFLADTIKIYKDHIDDFAYAYDQEFAKVMSNTLSLIDPNNPEAGNYLQAELENPAVRELMGMETINLKDDPENGKSFRVSKSVFVGDKTKDEHNYYNDFMILKNAHYEQTMLEYKKQKFEKNHPTYEEKQNYIKEVIATNERSIKAFENIRDIKDDSKFDPYMDNDIDTIVGRTEHTQREISKSIGWMRGTNKGYQNGWDIDDVAIMAGIGSMLEEASRIERIIARDEARYKAMSIQDLEKNKRDYKNFQDRKNSFEVFNKDLKELKDKTWDKKVNGIEDKKEVTDAFMEFCNKYLPAANAYAKDNQTDEEKAITNKDKYISHALSNMRNYPQIFNKVNKNITKEMGRVAVFKEQSATRTPDQFKNRAIMNGWPVGVKGTIAGNNIREIEHNTLYGLAVIQDDINNALSTGQQAALNPGKKIIGYALQPDEATQNWINEFNRQMSDIENKKVGSLDNYNKTVRDLKNLFDNVPEAINPIIQNKYKPYLKNVKSNIMQMRYNKRSEDSPQAYQTLGVSGERYEILNNLYKNFIDEKSKYRKSHKNNKEYTAMVKSLKELLELGPEDKIEPYNFKKYDKIKYTAGQKMLAYIKAKGLDVSAMTTAGTNRREGALLGIYAICPEAGDKLTKIINLDRAFDNQLNIKELMQKEGVGKLYPSDEEIARRKQAELEAKKNAKKTVNKKNPVTGMKK